MHDVNAPVRGDEAAIASPVGARDHKQLGATAFERTRMPMVMVDARQPDYPIVLANEAFLNLTGYAADEVIGRNCRFLQGPDTSEAAIAELRNAVASGREADVELLNYRKDGSPFWNKLYLSPITDDDGKLAYYFASQIDVTEFRKVQTLEASEHRLLMEVDHRTKNVLAIVDSIVRLSNADSPAAYASSVQERVRALAEAHAILSQASWQAVDLRVVVERQVSRYQNGSVLMIGPACPILPEAVQPLSLIIHELADNAVKHGSLARRRGGSLTIEWQPKTTDGALRLVWREAGGAIIPERASGFGTVIVGALIEKQLRGTIKREWRRDG
ncbi:MAG: PAS domain-containing protein, partial [Acetobacteraceae bacterium]